MSCCTSPRDVTQHLASPGKQQGWVLLCDLPLQVSTQFPRLTPEVYGKGKAPQEQYSVPRIGLQLHRRQEELFCPENSGVGEFCGVPFYSSSVRRMGSARPCSSAGTASGTQDALLQVRAPQQRPDYCQKHSHPLVSFSECKHG